MVVLQLTANVTGPEYVAIMSTSWPAGKNIGKYASQMSTILFSLGSLATQI